MIESSQSSKLVSDGENRMKCEATTEAENIAQPLRNLPVEGSTREEVNSMKGNHRVRCSMKHMEGASQLHEDGRFCDEWLWNLERGQFTYSQCNAIRRLVWRDFLFHAPVPDMGQLIRLEVSLSKTLPQKRWGLQKIAASLGPFKGMAKFEQEFRDAIGKK